MHAGRAGAIDLLAHGEPWQHRLLLDAEAEFAGTSSQTVIARVLDGIAAPQARTAA